ncbi:MAG: ABC transporter permease subunit [Clostridia bacterium]|nr:ABC transporter permease subunit [Clostridia bacterium]
MQTKKKKFSSSNRVMYLLLMPAVISVIIFNFLPFAGIVIAFKDFDVIDGIWGSPWVGFGNFIKIFKYPEMLASIKNTLVYSIVGVFGKFPFPILLALMFNEVRNMRFKKVVQTMSYFPHFLSWASVCALIYAMFAIDGPVNNMLAKIIGTGYERTNILMESKNFLPIMFFSGLWKELGWSSIIYLAALAGIDQSMYEAAEVDGCNRLKQTIYITLPSIKTTIILVLLLGMGSLVTSNFEHVYGLQNVYTQNETEVINTLVYRKGIQGGEYSLATAFGLMQGIVSVTLVILANKFSKAVSETSLW